MGFDGLMGDALINEGRGRQKISDRRAFAYEAGRRFLGGLGWIVGSDFLSLFQPFFLFQPPESRPASYSSF